MSSTINAMLDAGVTPPEDDGRDEFTGHADVCRGGAADCTCGASTKPGAPLEPTAADLPEGDYAIAEIMGHSTMIGRYAEVERFGTKMLSLEPIWENKLLPAVFVGGSSLYRFTPCTREVAFTRQPRQRYQLPDAVRATLPPEIRPALAAPTEEDELGAQYEPDFEDDVQF